MERNLNTLFAYECKRQPALAALVERIDTLTEAEIIATPVKLPWMRTALLQLKRDAAAKKLAIDLESVIVDGVVGDNLGWMRRWVGPNAFVSIGPTGLEMQPGQLVWVGSDGVWIDTIFVVQVPVNMLANTENVAQVTRTEYYLAVRKRTNGLSASAGISSEPDRAFRIYRP